MKKLLITACAILSLSACSTVKQELGMEKHAPDEFAVVTRAPLSVPPNYDLRPPEPGAARPQEMTTRDQAKQTVFETSVMDSPDAIIKTDSLESPVEQMLLHNSDASSTDPTIRRKVDSEAGQLLDAEDKTVNNILFWKDGPKPTEVLVDPQAEKDRLKKNAEEGKSVTDGETPKFKPKDRGILDAIN